MFVKFAEWKFTSFIFKKMHWGFCLINIIKKKVIYRDDGIIYYETPCICMMGLEIKLFG